MASRLIVSADDILKAVQEAERLEAEELRKAQERARAERKPIPIELPKKPGREIVLDYIKNPERRKQPRFSIKTQSRTENNNYCFMINVSAVRNRELADEICEDLRQFMDYILEEYDIPKRPPRPKKKKEQTK